MPAEEIVAGAAARMSPGSSTARARSSSLLFERDVIIIAGPEGVLLPAANRRAEKEVFGIKIKWNDRQGVEQAGFRRRERRAAGRDEPVEVGIAPAREVVGLPGGEADEQVGGAAVVRDGRVETEVEIPGRQRREVRARLALDEGDLDTELFAPHLLDGLELRRADGPGAQLQFGKTASAG